MFVNEKFTAPPKSAGRSDLDPGEHVSYEKPTRDGATVQR